MIIQKKKIWNEDNRQINTWRLQTYDKIKQDEFQKIFGAKKFKKSNIGAVDSEKDLLNIIKNFIPDTEILTHEKARNEIQKYLPDYNREPDILLKNYKLIFEFDGPDHYNKTLNIYKDRIKYKVSKDYKIIRWPYYLELNKPTAKFIFGDMIKHFKKQNSLLPKEGFYTDNKYEKVREKFYKNLFTGKGAKSEHEVTACGFSSTDLLPAQMCYEGLEILVRDLTWKCDCGCGAHHPKINLDQFMWSLKLYENDLKDLDDKWLIFPISKEGKPWHKKFMELYEKTIDQLENSSSESINYVFVRDKNSIRRTKP